MGVMDTKTAPDTFLVAARQLLLSRFGSLARAAIAMSENPSQLTHLLNGYRPARRLRRKVSETLDLPDACGV